MSNNDARTAIEFVLLRPDLRRMTTEQVTDAIIAALTAANLLIVPRAVVEECETALMFCGRIFHDMEPIRRFHRDALSAALDNLRACIPTAAADKQGAG